MINRVYIKDLISFSKIELELERGLVVLSGPSGAGKSLFMNSILSTFGYGLAEASVCEVSVSKPSKLKSELYELEDEITLKVLKREKARYYLEGQHISKKSLNRLLSPFVQFLSVRDKSGFESNKLIDLIDKTLITKDKNFRKILKEYNKRYIHYKLKFDELEKIKRETSKRAEFIEFTKFEIEKIESISPKVGEDIELIKIKQQLSRIDKINDVLASANEIFACGESVTELYRLLEKDDHSFIEMMNQLQVDFEEIASLSEELAGVDIESVLDRLEKISTLKNRYGSIEESLEYSRLKREELNSYKHIEKDKTMLESFLDMEYTELMILSNRISIERRRHALVLEKRVKKYLNELKLPPIIFIFTASPLDRLGQNKVSIDLNGSSSETLSGGEFNRVRLALMVVALEGVKEGGVLILDEIDANVSGDESIAIANMIAKLSSVYQVFAISHQAHLASKADQHLLISKLNNNSKVKILDKKGKIEEIARIIGGEKPNIEAISFAEKLIV